jgi:hypothetical protein
MHDAASLYRLGCGLLIRSFDAPGLIKNPQVKACLDRHGFTVAEAAVSVGAY